MSDISLSDNTPQQVSSQTPLQPVSPLFLALLALASFVMWMGLIPLTQTVIPMHVSALFASAAQATDKYRNTSLLQALGGLSAMIVYPLAGALSDRTWNRLGRRKPWILGGALGAALMLFLLSTATTFWLLTLYWLCFCIFANATQSSLFTLLPDKIPVNQRAKAAALIGLMAPVGIIAGTILAGKLGKSGFTLTYIIIAITEVIGVSLFVMLLHEEKPAEDMPPFALSKFVAGFWINPRTYPDFARAWWARVLFILGYATAQNYLLFFLQDVGLFSTQQASQGVAIFQVFSTVGLLLGSFGTGYFSDKMERRKPFAVIAGICVCGGLLIMALIHVWAIVCIAAFVLGLGFGIYSATEIALGTQVLTSDKSHGKDMGVLSLGGNIPQAVAPLYSSAVITLTHSYTLLFGLAALPPLLSSFFITQIKRVK